MTTTQDRISRLIFEGYESSLFEGYTVYNTEIPAAKIAAEIDDLTERNAFLLTSAETAQAKLAEARAEVEKLTILARALELLKGEGWTVADYVAQAEEEARAAKAVQP